MGGFTVVAAATGHFLQWLGSDDARRIGAYFIGIVFAASGVPKLLQPREASLALANYRLTRHPVAAQGYVVAVLELGLAIWITTQLLARLAIGMAASLLWFFTALLFIAAARHETFDCFCFGKSHRPISGLTAVRSAILAALATALWIAPAASLSVGFAFDRVMDFEIALGSLCLLALMAAIQTVIRESAVLYSLRRGRIAGGTS